MGSERLPSKPKNCLINTPYPLLLICFQSMPQRQMEKIFPILYYKLLAQGCLASHTLEPLYIPACRRMQQL